MPDGSLLVLVGDLTPARALDQVGRGSRRLGHQRQPDPGAEGPRRAARAAAAGRPAGRRAVEHPDGRVGPGPHRPVVRGAEVANALFGGYFSSRLVMNIREDKGYTYSPRSSLRHAPAASCLLTAADVATEVTAAALVEIGYELGRMATAAAVGGRGRRDRAVPGRVAGALDRDPGRPGGDPVGAAGRRARRHLAARPPERH